MDRPTGTESPRDTVSGVAAKSPLPPGLSLTHLPPRGRRGLGAWVAMPARVAPDAVPLIAVHGIKRGARDQALAFAAAAAAEGRPVIAPCFDTERWSNFQQVVRHGRADTALEALMDEVRAEGIVRSARFDLCGYSAGAQFAHRFAMLHPQSVRRLTLVSAGWYTHPDAAAFPYGLGVDGRGSADWGALMQARLPDYLALPITVAVGEADCVIDCHTRTGPVLDDQQGATRLERAHRYVGALGKAAAGLSLPGPRLSVLPGAGHSFDACLGAGLLDLMFAGGGATAAPAR
ncbi:MAG: PHB depolymerase family esterase [Pseudomonadota bacterium]